MTKINITNEEDFKEPEVQKIKLSEPEESSDEKTEEQSFKPRKMCLDEKDKTLEKIYEDEGLKLIQRPPRMSRQPIIIGVIIAFIVGLLSGIVGTILFLKFF